MKTLLILWSAQRRRCEGGFDRDLPGNYYWGFRELSERFDKTIQVFPAEHAPLRILARASLLSLFSIPSVIRFAPSADLIATYTTRHIWHLTALRLLGVVRSRVYFYHGGIDVDPRRLARSALSRFIQGLWLETCSAVHFATALEKEEWAAAFPRYAEKFKFLPQCIDYDFYDRVSEGVTDKEGDYFVAVGNDRMRDWDAVAELIRRGYKIVILTHNAEVASRFRTEFGDKADIRRGLDAAASGAVIAGARGVLLATRENARFSGSTTAGVAAALRKALILDEAYELESYGLAPGRSCLTFDRGDVDTAARHLDDLLSDKGKAQALGEALRQTSTIPSPETTARHIVSWVL